MSEAVPSEELGVTRNSTVFAGEPKDRFKLKEGPALFEQLCDAVRGGDQELYLHILKYHPDLINMKGQFGDTVLHWAILSGQDKAVKKLVMEFGADVNLTSKNFADGHTPLHLTVPEIDRALSPARIRLNRNCEASRS
eukprot:TRINITY_DN20289_c0_g1_i1.p1 TRINITY_DN20289_c0_g1~~TRINITY_DN20289_c0_g1_i1.p1  ORF type:complete len:138 (-),score=32.30 TRINITY_DN20289_c0_g1_i1:229-642(-)